MIEFGKSLREAREAKGLTISELASLTRMVSSAIEDLENEDFKRIPAPIYGRGFVKLYCEAVGLDVKTYVAEFMSIYNGDREPVIREREAAEAPEPTIQPEATAPAAPLQPPTEEISGAEPAQKPIEDLFSMAANDTPKAPPPKAAPPRFVPPDMTQDVCRPKAPIRLPHVPWRMIVLITMAIALAFAIAYSLRILYRATTSTRPTKVSEVQVEKPQPKKPTAPAPAKKKVPRQAQSIPSLYID